MEVSNALVSPVDGHEILEQIVGSDAEELHFTRKRSSSKGSTRHLNHDSKLHIGLVGDASLAQLL